MKKLNVSQMENLQGSWGRREWCLVGAGLGVGVAIATGPGVVGALTIMASAATALGC